MDRVDAALPTAFPALQQDQRIRAFIKQVGVHQIEEMFEKHAAGECQCIEATAEGLEMNDWFGSDFYYEDNWGFSEGCLKGYDGCTHFPERFPDEGGWDESAGTYSYEKLFALLRQCVCETIQSACCCEASAEPAEGAAAAAAAALTALPADPVPAQADGVTRALTGDSISNMAFCSVTGRLFCLGYTASTHNRFLVVFDADSGDEVGRLANETIAAGCHAEGGPICVGGRMLMFGDGERFFQVYDCATLRELYAGPNPKPGKSASDDAIRDAKLFNGELFTSCYHYARRWDVRGVLGDPAQPPVLLTEYSGTGNSCGSTHDIQVVDDDGRSLFVACDEQSIRAYDLHKSRCIKKGVSGWVQQLLPAGGGRFVCTGASMCGEESVWTVSAVQVKKLTELKIPDGYTRDNRVCQHPRTGQHFAVADTKLLELDLDLARGSSAWKVVRVVGDLPKDRTRPFVSAEGRLYTYSRGGLREWVV